MVLISALTWIGTPSRETLRAALEVSTQDQLLALLGTTETGFLAGWENWVLSD